MRNEWMKTACAAAAVVMMSGAAWASPAAPVRVQPMPGNAPAAAAEEPQARLSIGDAAPAMDISQWVKGKPVTGFERGRVYVVEFWATWCGPCRVSIPHLTEVQKKYKDRGVTVIGVTSGEKLETVESFVETQGDGMDYVVAWDNERETSARYMRAANQRGIPTAFIVDQESRVVWIGHPMGKMDSVLERVVNGTFDHVRQAEIDRAVNRLTVEMRAAQREQNWDLAGDLMDQIAAVDTEMAGEMASQKWMMLMRGAKDYERAYAHVANAAKGPLSDNAEVLNRISWTILDAPWVEQRDVVLAHKLAVRACELTEHKNAMILDTLARAEFENGHVERAVATQEKAVRLAKNEQEREGYQKALDRYKEAKGRS